MALIVINAEWSQQRVGTGLGGCLIMLLSKYDLEYPLSYGVPVRERYGFTLLPATREQHDQNCTQSH